MSWFDRIGDAVGWLGDVTGVSDVVTELSDAFDPDSEWGILPFGPNERNPQGSVTTMDAIGAPVKAALWAGTAYYTHVVEPLQDQLVYGALALQAPLWKPEGQSTWDYVRPGGTAYQARDNLSMAEAMAAGGVGMAQRVNLGGLDAITDPMLRGLGTGNVIAAITAPLWDGTRTDKRWDLFDPIEKPNSSRDFYRTTGYRHATGLFDFTKDLVLDPLTFAGAPVKAATTTMRAAKVIGEGEKGALRSTRFLNGTVTATALLENLDNGRYASAKEFLVNSTDARANAVFAQKAGLSASDPATFGYLTSVVDNGDDFNDLARVLWNTGSREAEEAATRLKAKYGDGFNYTLRRSVNDDILHAEKVGTVGDIMDGPVASGIAEDVVARTALDPEMTAAMSRAEAFSRGIDTVMYDAKGTRQGGKFVSNALPDDKYRLGRMAERGAERKTARALAGISKDPVVTVVKKSRWYPKQLIVERPRGFVEPENADSLNEVIAQIREIDHVTRGEFVSSGKADEFMDRWMRASTLASPQSERGSIAAGLNNYLVSKLALTYGLDEATAVKLSEAAADKMARGTRALREKGWLSVLTDEGDMVIMRHPVLQRSTPNAVQLYDARALRRSFESYNRDALRRSLDAWKTGAVDAADLVNNIFKVSVLMRLGYTIRNISEAALSIAATGNLGHVVAAVGPERWDTWMKAAGRGSGRVIDRVLTSSGVWDDLTALGDQLVAHDAVEAATEKQISELVRALGQVNTYKLIQSTNPKTRALATRIEQFKIAVAEREVTYHATKNPAFKVNPAKPLSTSPSLTIADHMAGTLGRQRSIRPVESYGKTLDLVATPGAGGITRGDVTAAAAGDRAAAKRIIDAANVQGFARVVIPDADAWGGVQVLVHPDAIGGRGLSRLVQRRLDEAGEAFLKQTGEFAAPPKPSMAQRRGERAMSTRYRAQGNPYPSPISATFDEDLFQSMLDHGLEDVALQLAARREALRVRGDALRARAAVARRRVDKTQRLHVTGQQFGTRERQFVSFNGVDYDKVQGPFASNAGGLFESLTSNDASYHTLALGTDQALMASGAAVVREVDPSNPRYYEAWRNMLNHHFRDDQSLIADPVVMRYLDGASFDELYDWATTTREGYNWAHGIGLTKTAATRDEALARGALAFADKRALANPKRVEDAVAGLMQATDLYLPAGPIRDAFRAGEDITEDLLRAAVPPEKAVPLNGRLVPTSAEAQHDWGWKDHASSGVTRLMRTLGSVPETSFARHPLFVAEHRKEMMTRVSLAEEQFGRRVTVAEWNSIDLAAKRAAKESVEKTLYTVVRRSNLSSHSAMRLAFPFLSPYENVLHRWGGFVRDDPSLPLRAANLMQKMVNGAIIVDSNGERVTDLKGLTGDGAMLVLPGLDKMRLPGKWGEAAKSLMSTTQVPVKSLDLLFQGEVNPGFGPFAMLPLAEIVRRQPKFEEVLGWAMPYGVPEGNVEIFLPTAAKRWWTLVSKDSAGWTNTVTKTMLHEQWLFEQGKRSTKPTMDEVLRKAKGYYQIRIAAALLSPAALSFSNERDWYAAKMRSLQETYGREEGEAKFYLDYPDAGLLVQSLSKNKAGALATAESVDALSRYSDEVAAAYAQGDPDLAGFIANYGQPDTTEFSQAAYQWERLNAAVPGSQDTFRQAANPEEAVREAKIAEGWRFWRQVTEEVASALTAAGFTPEHPYYADRMSAAKRAAAQHLVEQQQNTAWWAEYSNPDSSKYYRRAQFFEGLLSDSQFARDHVGDPLMRSISVYFATRQRVQDVLAARKAQGGAGTLSARDNFDVSAEWEARVEQLKVDSPEFAAWVNRYFQNDPVGLY